MTFCILSPPLVMLAEDLIREDCVPHLFFVLHGAADSVSLPGEEQSPREKGLGRGGRRGPRGLSFPFLISQLAYRILQMNKHCSRCADNSGFWDYLGLFELGFSCTEGFCEICWVCGHGETSSFRFGEAKKLIPLSQRTMGVHGFVLGNYLFKSK